MAELKPLLDEYGVIYEALKKIPDSKLKLEFLEALAELEDNACHRSRSFPKTRLHRVRGIKESIYRADINKISGWRIHLQYVDGNIVLKDVIEGQRHDDVIKVIKTKRTLSVIRRACIFPNDIPTAIYAQLHHPPLQSDRLDLLRLPKQFPVNQVSS